jgi:hypothetical protein
MVRVSLPGTLRSLDVAEEALPGSRDATLTPVSCRILEGVRLLCGD